MPALRSLIPLAASLATGAAIYFGRAVLDQVEINGSVVRVALLPPWPVMVGLVGLALVVITGCSRRAASDRRPALGEIVLPLCALSVLAVPYLPVVPDQWPLLQMLAGPVVGLVWLVVVGLQGWALWQARVIGAPALGHWPLPRLTAAIFVATLGVSGLAAWRLTSTSAYPGGDEPHYLVIAQSIWRDGDLDIQNNHTRGDYYEYVSMELAPHYLVAGIGGVFYSVHPILMPFLMAPVYAAGGYAGVVALFVVVAAAAATLAWRWVRGVLNATGAATFAWAAIAGSGPYLFNSFTVYPETCAALSVMIAMTLAVTTPRARRGAGRHLAIGLACAALPWFHTKYAPMSAALLLVALGRLWHQGARPLWREPKAWAVSVPYAASLLAWFAFFYAYWGSPLPTAQYGEHGQSSPLHLLRAGPGLWFDQEYGLLAFAPAYILAATGLVKMCRAGGDLRRQAIEIVLVFGALFVTVGSFAQWYGGSSPPSRHLVSGLFLLALPIAVAFQDAPEGSARRASQHLLLWVGFGIAVTLALAQNGLLIDSGGDGSAALLEYWSPRWELWALTPTFTFHAPIWASVHATWWLTIAAGAAALLSRCRPLAPGAAALVAIAVFAAALSIVAITMPWLPAGPARPPIDLAARSRLKALDDFDASVRPTAMRYDELRTLPSFDVLPHLKLSVMPMSRVDRQPLQLIHNARFSLPAGTYNIEVTFGSQVPSHPTPFSVQVGRLGNPLQSWNLQPDPGQVWRTTLRIEVDANFVGFRGPAEMERAISNVAITPMTIINESERPRVPTVLSAATYPGATLYFHDEQLYPEARGIWTRGQRLSLLTVAPAPDRTEPVVLRITCGSRGNTATLSADGWQRQVVLVPGQVVDVELPAPIHGVIPLTIATTSAFRPRDIDPSSRDPRVLGIWVEVNPE